MVKRAFDELNSFDRALECQRRGLVYMKHTHRLILYVLYVANKLLQYTMHCLLTVI